MSNSTLVFSHRRELGPGCLGLRPMWSLGSQVWSAAPIRAIPRRSLLPNRDDCGTKRMIWNARRATSNKNSFARRIRRRPPLRRRLIRRRRTQARVFVSRVNGPGRTSRAMSGPRRLRVEPMPARDETAAMRYHDFGLLVTLGGPMAEQCLWDSSNLMERAAVHEAGHCVMAWRIGHGIANVVIRSDGSGLATTAPMGVGTAEAVALHTSEAHGPRRGMLGGRPGVP